jgi:hypothetical protein
VGANFTCELQVAAQLLVEARRADPSVRGSLRAAVAAAHLLLRAEGEFTTAHRLLVGALESPALPTEEPGEREGALLLLLEICIFSGRPPLWRSFFEVQARHPDALSPVVSVVARLLGDPAGVSSADVALVEDAIEGLRTEPDPAVIMHVSTAAYFLDRAYQCRQALWRLVEDGRAGNAVIAGVGALAMLAANAFDTGQWDLSQSLCEEGLSTCSSSGLEIMRWPFLYSRATLGAARGEQELVEALVREMDAWATPRRLNAVTGYARQVETLHELGRGNAEAAYAHATALCRPGELPAGGTAGTLRHDGPRRVGADERSSRRGARPCRRHEVGRAHGACASARSPDSGRGSHAAEEPDASACSPRRSHSRVRTGSPSTRRGPASPTGSTCTGRRGRTGPRGARRRAGRLRRWGPSPGLSGLPMRCALLARAPRRSNSHPRRSRSPTSPRPD